MNNHRESMQTSTLPRMIQGLRLLHRSKELPCSRLLPRTFLIFRVLHRRLLLLTFQWMYKGNQILLQSLMVSHKCSLLETLTILDKLFWISMNQSEAVFLTKREKLQFLKVFPRVHKDKEKHWMGKNIQLYLKVSSISNKEENRFQMKELVTSSNR